ncbi:MAG: hypothetical protein QOK15_2586 [Nocardioidaceae bacterium]|jgi:hypothetical protein|nr:hypothetical protein [Nocardioidaceae bacterium]
MSEQAGRGSNGRPDVALVATRTVGAERVEDQSLEELTFQASAGALLDAGLTASSVGSVVLFGQDQMNGRVISCMVAAGPAGGVDRDVTMIASSGEHALIYAYLRLLAGQGDSVLVVAWDKPSEGLHPDHAELVHAEPYLLRRLGMNNAVAAALQASRLGHVPDGGAVETWPLTTADLPATYDSVHAAVLRRQGTFDPGSEIAWIRGVGWAMDVYDLGGRDPAELASLEAVVGQLDRQGAPLPVAWERVEIAAPSEPLVGRIASRLGVPATCAVNPSASTSTLEASALTAGFARMITAAQASDDGAAVTAGVGMQGFAGQGVAAMVFGKE